MIGFLQEKTIELAFFLYHVRIQQDGSLCKPGGGPSPEPIHAHTLISDFLAYRTVGNKYCLRHSVYGICYCSLC
jgi:hypothetical protein